MSNDIEVSALKKEIEKLQKELKSIKCFKNSYEAFFQKSRDAIVIVSKEGFIDCNKAVLDMFQYDSKEEFLKQHPGSLSPEYQPDGRKSRDYANYLLDRTLDENLPIFEWTHQKKDGTNFPCEILLDSIIINKEKTTYALIRDISDRKSVIEALVESEQKFKSIIEHSTNIFYSHTTDHVLTYVSPQVRNVLGYSPEEALIKWTELATDNPINEKGFKLTIKAIETGKIQRPYELELIHKSGTKVYVEVREAPVVENGKTIAIVGALADITEQKIIGI